MERGISDYSSERVEKPLAATVINISCICRRVGLLTVICQPLLLTGAHAEDAALPQYGLDKHLGVASCAASTCHGAVQPWHDQSILRNEYVVWSREDRHAKAYETLFTKESRRIARNLGLKAAHEADICLDCHADNIDPLKRGDRFQVADGVGCEACHGGAERWIDAHTDKDHSHTSNLELGLYPTDEPIQRAKLCLSCHFGNESKFVTHRIMGAGHPRLSFELDTFTQIQPAHFRVDDDYARRKQVSDSLQVWALGQAVALGEFLDALLDPQRGRDGLFPELVLRKQSSNLPLSI